MNLLPSGLPEAIDDGEKLARFLTQSSHFNSSTAKPSAFLPNQKDRTTSVSRCGDDNLGELWVLGSEAAGGRTLYGAALVSPPDIREAELQAKADEPPLFHAVIIGWPWMDDDAEMQKAIQKEKAAVLSSRSKLVLRA